MSVDRTSEEQDVRLESNVVTLPWYRRINEDWWATIIGLLLVILIVSRFITAIP